MVKQVIGNLIEVRGLGLPGRDAMIELGLSVFLGDEPLSPRPC